MLQRSLFVQKQNGKEAKFKSTRRDIVPKISMDEIDQALTELKTSKCQDIKNISAELLKHTGIETLKVQAKMCTDIMRGDDIPKSWNKSTITVLHKAGETADAFNYRPICILDITYKIMSRVLYNRIITKFNAA